MHALAHSLHYYSLHSGVATAATCTFAFDVEGKSGPGDRLAAVATVQSARAEWELRARDHHHLSRERGGVVNEGDESGQRFVRDARLFQRGWNFEARRARMREREGERERVPWV